MCLTDDTSHREKKVSLLIILLVSMLQLGEKILKVIVFKMMGILDLNYLCRLALLMSCVKILSCILSFSLCFLLEASNFEEATREQNLSPHDVSFLILPKK